MRAHDRVSDDAPLREVLQHGLAGRGVLAMSELNKEIAPVDDHVAFALVPKPAAPAQHRRNSRSYADIQQSLLTCGTDELPLLVRHARARRRRGGLGSPEAARSQRLDSRQVRRRGGLLPECRGGAAAHEDQADDERVPTNEGVHRKATPATGKSTVAATNREALSRSWRTPSATARPRGCDSIRTSVTRRTLAARMIGSTRPMSTARRRSVARARAVNTRPRQRRASRESIPLQA